jgi:uncharacterized protein DUF4136
VTSLPRLTAAIVGTIAVVATLACAPMRVRSFTEPGIDFAGYHTYAWAERLDTVTGDPRLDNNPFFQTRLMADVDRELARRGFEKRTSGTPDLYVHYHSRITQELDVRTVDREYAACQNCGASVYDAGTILIDFVDGRSEKLAWRGWVETSMQGAIDNQRWMEEQIDQAVTRILERLPARL